MLLLEMLLPRPHVLKLKLTSPAGVHRVEWGQYTYSPRDKRPARFVGFAVRRWRAHILATKTMMALTQIVAVTNRKFPVL
jgi:hypothetical protein